MRNLAPAEIAIGGSQLGELICPAGIGACLTPTGIAKVRSSLAELIEWYKQAKIQCGGTTDENHNNRAGTDAGPGSN